MRDPIQRKVDLLFVQNRTVNASYYFEKCIRAVEDADADARRADAQCRYCYYIAGRVGGSMCTTALCGLCGGEMRFGSTCVDVVCKGCAVAKRLCRHCGCDREFRNRRKL